MKMIKEWMKKNENSSNIFLRFIIKCLHAAGHFAWKCKMFFTDGQFRSVVMMQILHPNRVQQTTQLTWYDRYPEVFQTCKKYFEENGKKDIKILSYGCCTGEEVVTLRKYFPEATIIGAEINKRSLEICRERKLDEKIAFVLSTHKNIMEHGPYDAVFCMAVLQRLPHQVIEKEIKTLKKMYPFEKFEKQIEELNEYVKPDGLLVIHNTQYDLPDTRLAALYTSYGDCGHVSALFDKNSDVVSFEKFRKSVYVKSEK